MTVQVVHGDNVYDFETGDRWFVDGSHILVVYNSKDDAIATFLRWDNVSRVTEAPKITFGEGAFSIKNGEDITVIIEKALKRAATNVQSRLF